MQASEIRQLDTTDIENRIAEEEEQLRKLRFQHAIARLENPLVLREKRRTIARLKTVLNERRAEAQA